MNVLGAVKKLLFPKENLIGLEINDTALRLISLSDGNLSLRKISVVLEPGVIESGVIKNQPKFLDSLKQLHNQFVSPKDKAPVILVMPSFNIYSKVFSVPPLAGENLEQAVELNLRSISPIEFESAYADWQQVGSEEKEGKIEVLGAFAPKIVVDSYIRSLEAANFLPIAVEFSALAIARAIKEYATDLDLNSPKVAINLASDGIDFLVIKNGNLYFNYFVPWKLVMEEGTDERVISLKDFQATLLREIKKVVTFYGSHWGGKLDQLILVTQALEQEVSDFIKTNFNLSVINLKLRQFPDLPSSWYPVIGSAIRGTIARGEDNFISLMSVGTEKGYFYAQIDFFAKIWRQVILVSLGFIFLLFVLADSFLARTGNNVSQQFQELAAIPVGKEAAELEGKAKTFNQLVAKALFAKEKSRPYSVFFEKLNNLSREVTLLRVSIDGVRQTASLSGSAKDESAAINFKNKLIQQGFSNVSLPLSDLRSNTDGSVSFSLTLSL